MKKLIICLGVFLLFFSGDLIQNNGNSLKVGLNSGDTIYIGKDDVYFETLTDTIIHMKFKFPRARIAFRYDSLGYGSLNACTKSIDSIIWNSGFYIDRTNTGSYPTQWDYYVVNGTDTSLIYTQDATYETYGSDSLLKTTH